MAEQQLPVWNSKGVEPPVNLQRDGWQPGVKPPAQYFDWLFNRAYECLEELQAITKELEINKANGTELKSLQQQVTQHSNQIPTKTILGHVKLQEDFIHGALQNGWQGTFEYAKNDLGMVSLAMEGYGTVVAGNTVIATLPVGYRPKKAITIPIATDMKDGIQHLIITSGGSVEVPTDAPVVVNKVYLASISFYAKEE